jgi:hypothetical protein
VALVAGARDRLRRNALLVRAGSGLRDLEQVPPDRLLSRIVAADLDVAALPELVEPTRLLGP